jgi:tRNA-dihydrouridine synthase
MAGVTNAPFRSLCREFGAGLYVSEMVTARGLVDGHLKTTRLAHFDPDESPRSIQLYGTEPESIRRAVDLLVGEGRVDHIDMNFGCPMPKVTRRGGGAAIPLKPRLFEDIVRAAVDSSGDVPVTVKFRKGTDDDHLTFLEAGRIAEAVGAAAVSLHARTAEQLYSGEADWSAVADLKAAVTGIPVFRQRRRLGAVGCPAPHADHRLRRCGGRARLPGPTLAVRRPGSGLRQRTLGRRSGAGGSPEAP